MFKGRIDANQATAGQEMLLSCSFLDLRRGASHLWDRGLPRHRARTVEARINQLSNLDRDLDALPNPASVINDAKCPLWVMNVSFACPMRHVV